MIKIIGETESQALKVTACGGCKAVLSYHKTDVRRDVTLFEVSESIKCPSCGCSVILHYENVYEE